MRVTSLLNETMSKYFLFGDVGIKKFQLDSLEEVRRLGKKLNLFTPNGSENELKIRNSFSNIHQCSYLPVQKFSNDTSFTKIRMLKQTSLARSYFVHLICGCTTQTFEISLIFAFSV